MGSLALLLNSKVINRRPGVHCTKSYADSRHNTSAGDLFDLLALRLSTVAIRAFPVVAARTFQWIFPGLLSDLPGHLLTFSSETSSSFCG